MIQLMDERLYSELLSDNNNNNSEELKMCLWNYQNVYFVIISYSLFFLPIVESSSREKVWIWAAVWKGTSVNSK